MKLLASADHHFDEHSRFEQCIRVHADMVDVARRERVDVFLSAGDIYERASTPKEREAAADWLVHMAEVCPVVITRGNHDKDLDLEILARLESRHPIHVISQACVVHVAGAAIAAVPWPNPAALKVSGMEPKEALRGVLRGLGSQMEDHDGPRILLGHLMVDGSTVSNGQPLLGQPINVGLDDLALANAHLGIMGHIHKAQRWDINGHPHLYTGSPFRTEFGQTEEKTFVLAEFDGNKLVSLEEIPTAASPMVHLTGEWDEVEGVLYADVDENQVIGAEVRLRYEVPLDRRVKAKEMALRYKEEILQCGALSVKVEEVPVVVKRARAPEVARSRSIAEKLPAHWESIGFDPRERREALLEKAHAVEEEVGTGGVGPTSLRLHRFRCRDLGPVRGEWGFDLDKFPEGSIVAFTGKNGAGKTHALEMSIGGACHRRTQTQNTPLKRASSRDSLLESVISSGGRTWTLRHGLDGIGGHSTALVLDENKKPVNEDTKVSVFDTWTAKNLPDPSVLYSTQFAAQPGKKSRPRFIDLDSADRISVLLKTLGVERIEAMAAEARRWRDSAQNDFEKASTRLADEVERTGDVKVLRKELDAAEKKVAEAAELVALTQKSLDQANEKNRQAQLEETRREAKRVEKAKVERDFEALQLKVRELKHRKANLEQALVGTEEDQALVDSLPELENERKLREENELYRKRHAELREKIEGFDREIADVERQIALGDELLRLNSDIRSAAEEYEELAASLLRLGSEKDVLTRRISDVQRALSDESADGRRRGELVIKKAKIEAVLTLEADVVAAVERFTEVLGEYDDAEADLRLLTETLEELQSSHVAGAEERISSLRHGLANITLTPAAAERIAHDALDEDDKAVELAKTLPAETTTAKQRVREAQARLDKARAEKDEVSKLAAKRDAIVEARNQLDGVTAELAEIDDRRGALRGGLDSLKGELNGVQTLIDETDAKWELLKPLASRLGALETAEAVVAEKRKLLAATQERREVIISEKIRTPVPDNLDRADVEDRIRAAEQARERQAERATARARLEELDPQLDTAVAAEAKLAESLESFGDLSPVDMVDTSEKERSLEVLKAEETKARNAVAEASVRLKTANERSAHIDVIRQEKTRLSNDVSDWTRLALDFGRGGIQSAEVDSAGEILTELCNDLLHECHGPRFTVSIETKALSADGKKDLDRCYVRVIDTEAGREDDASSFSGGERVLLSECIENGLLALACIKHDVTGATIIRDESGAALDPANGRAYLKMLRAVVEKVKAANLLIVTHSTELQEMVDARIEVVASTSRAQSRAEEDAAE